MSLSLQSGSPRVLGVTLARGGSKGVPGKNIRNLLGRPLLEYTIREALQSRLVSEYIVSTDSPEIAQVAERAGAQVPFLRPDYLASDEATSVSALSHAVHWMESITGAEYDLVVEIMNTNPLKTAEDIDNCIRQLIETGSDSVVAVHEILEGHPARIKKIVNGNLVDFCIKEPHEARRQDLQPKAYLRSGSIYAMTRRELLEEGRRHGSEKCRAYILPPERVVNIDSEMDWLLAEAILSRGENL